MWDSLFDQVALKRVDHGIQSIFSDDSDTCESASDRTLDSADVERERGLAVAWMRLVAEQVARTDVNEKLIWRHGDLHSRKRQIRNQVLSRNGDELTVRR